MLQYIIRRIMLVIPVLFAILIVTFSLARLLPGEPCKSILGEKATREACDRFNERFGLNEPIPVQFGIYINNVAHGDFGDSIRFGRPVALMLVERLPVTIELGVSAMILALLIGIPAGILSAIKRNSLLDIFTMVGANFGVSIPIFFLGLVLVYIFAVMLKGTPFALPPSGRLTAGLSNVPFYKVFEIDLEKDTLKFYFYTFIANHLTLNSIITRNWEVLWDGLKHLILPAVALSTIPLSIIARMTRSSMLSVLDQDYIRTARAKGLKPRTIVLRHAFRSALLPVVTVIGLQLGAVLGGAILTETIFGLSGVGKSLFEAITSRDFPVIQGFTILIAFTYVFFNLLVDLSYAYLDPRVRLQ